MNWTERLSLVMKLQRETRGESLREYAAHLGVSPATLCRIEQGKPCDVDTLLAIHRRTGIALGTLLGLEGKRT